MQSLTVKKKTSITKAIVQGETITWMKHNRECIYPRLGSLLLFDESMKLIQWIKNKTFNK